MALNLSAKSSENKLDDKIIAKCVRLKLAQNLVAYCKKDELLRDTEPLQCDSSLAGKVTSNYLIAKRILSYLPWQEKLIAKLVCSTWCAAVTSLQKDLIGPRDFVLYQKVHSVPTSGYVYLKSGNFDSEPLVVITFSNTSLDKTLSCFGIEPSLCNPECSKSHILLDIANRDACAPKDCMLTVKTDYLSYMPLSHSSTYKRMIVKWLSLLNPFYCGVYIPTIPDVKYHNINITSISKMQEEFFEPLNKLAETEIVKGVLVFVTEKYLLNSVEEIVFLNHFKKVQPNVPYALGGCLIEDSVYGKNYLSSIVNAVNTDKEYVSENLVSIGIFTIPKSDGENKEKNNFEMYSFILESTDWSKSKIQKVINDFSQKIPYHEHSIIFKLSCVGRDKRHETEQNYIRAAFPNTRLIGVYGNGELGVNHPPRVSEDEPPHAKRHRDDPGPQYGIMYSYSSVYVYMGWGKVLS